MMWLEEMSSDDKRKQIAEYLKSEHSDNAYVSLVSVISNKYYKTVLSALLRLYSQTKPSGTTMDDVVNVIAELNDESIIKDIDKLADTDTFKDLFDAVDMMQFFSKHIKEFSESLAKLLYDLISQRIFEKLAEEIILNVLDDNDINKVYDMYKLTEPDTKDDKADDSNETSDNQEPTQETASEQTAEQN